MYDNKNYPHPVLGVSDSVGGDFPVKLAVKAEKKQIHLEVEYRLSNKAIEGLILQGKAGFVTHLYCRSTMNRMCWKHPAQGIHAIVLHAHDVRDAVELHFFVVAVQAVNSYVNRQAHPDYGRSAFHLDVGDVLAFGGKAQFFANKRPEELTAISSLMNVNKSKDKSGPIKTEYDADKITILLPEDDYEMYQQLKENSFSVSVLHSSVVLPALMDALREAQQEQYKDRRWHQILSEIVTQNHQQDELMIAQKILDNPINRGFGNLKQLVEAE